MIHLLKADLRRLFRNIFFVSGCVLALIITWIYTARGEKFAIQYDAGANEYMVFVSVGVLAFFSLFPGFFQSLEYENGAIRNKMIVGHSQLCIYLSEYVTLCIASLTMIICWLFGGILGGAVIDLALLKYTVILSLLSMAYASIMTVICMRITKGAIAVCVQIFVLQVCFNAAIILHAIITALDGAVAYAFKLIMCMVPFGQWFVNTSFAERGASPGDVVQMLCSIMVILLFMTLGTFRINQRDVK